MFNSSKLLLLLNNTFKSIPELDSFNSTLFLLYGSTFFGLFRINLMQNIVIKKKASTAATIKIINVIDNYPL